jgi:hypothetical protein
MSFHEVQFARVTREIAETQAMLDDLDTKLEVALPDAKATLERARADLDKGMQHLRRKLELLNRPAGALQGAR